MKQDDKEKTLKESSEKAALKDALLEEKDTDKINGGVLPFPFPTKPPEEPS